MTGVISDEELYARVQAGDGGALETLVQRYHGPLLAYLWRYTDDRHLAEDLVQDTFVRLMTYRGGPPRRFRPWAYTVAVNLARDYFRTPAHRRERAGAFHGVSEDEMSLRPVAAGSAIDDLMELDAERRQVALALQALSPRHREVLMLRFYHDLSLKEIAEITGAALGTVKSRLFHALRQMKGHLIREGGMGYDEAATRPEPRTQP